ncbi:hypothetical protein DBA29_12575 [Xenophilus aerolatus]|nr:hypothetical protein [Xenophilus aerolatus]
MNAAPTTNLRAHALSALTLACAAVLPACTTMRGAPPVVAATGAVAQPTTPASGLIPNFVAAESAASTDPMNADKARLMLELGFTLVYANCSDFFATAGHTQKWLVFSRDVVGAVGTLSTSVMALHHAGQTAVANVAIATGLGFTGLDLYTKNFLFSAENIDGVRELTTRALSTHRQALGDIEPMTYGSALTALSDHQNICAPMHIAALAKEAIKKGIVVASSDPASGAALVAQVQDQGMLRALGALLQMPGPVTAQQAGALWWLLRESPTPAQTTGQIASALADIPAAANPFGFPPGGTPVRRTPWPQEAEVQRLLDGFSSTTQAAFHATVVSAKPPAAGGPGAAPAALGIPRAPSPVFKLGAPPLAGARDGHVSVGIR